MDGLFFLFSSAFTPLNRNRLKGEGLNRIFLAGIRYESHLIAPLLSPNVVDQLTLLQPPLDIRDL